VRSRHNEPGITDAGFRFIDESKFKLVNGKICRTYMRTVVAVSPMDSLGSHESGGRKTSTRSVDSFDAKDNRCSLVSMLCLHCSAKAILSIDYPDSFRHFDFDPDTAGGIADQGDQVEGAFHQGGSQAAFVRQPSAAKRVLPSAAA